MHQRYKASALGVISALRFYFLLFNFLLNRTLVLRDKAKSKNASAV